MPAETEFPALLETERLQLRRHGSADAQRVFTLVAANRTVLVRSFPQLARDLTRIEDTRTFIGDMLAQWNERKKFCYGIWLNSSAELIGQIQIKNISWEVPSGELSYFVGSSFQRRGFATESISVMLRVSFGELNFNRIFVRILPSNQESFLLAQKLGFKHEGLHRNEYRCGYGELHNVHYFSMTKEDYRAVSGSSTSSANGGMILPSPERRTDQKPEAAG